MKMLYFLLLLCIGTNLVACNSRKSSSLKVSQIENSISSLKTDSMKLKITVGENTFTATLYDNETATAFKAKLPMTINMIELNGNEKYFDLSDNLPANASKPGTIQTGDLMIYGDNTLVLFYKTFTTPYSYTPLARINHPSALGSGSVTVTFEME
jgi:hypothetical protein